MKIKTSTRKANHGGKHQSERLVMDRIEALGSREAYLKRVHSFLVFYRKYLANWQAVCLSVVQGLNPPPLEFSRPVP